MVNILNSTIRNRVLCLSVICMAFCVIGSVRSSGAVSPANSTTVVNNSAGEVVHIYLSPADSDNWGPDQLNGAAIGKGASFTLSNGSCDHAQIKVITEDRNGCFLSKVVSCSDDTVWTITDSDTPNCGY